MQAGRHQFIQLGKDFLSPFQRGAVITAVPLIQQMAFLIDEGSLDCGRTGINAQPGSPSGIRQRVAGNMMGRVALPECLIVFFGAEQRREGLYFGVFRQVGLMYGFQPWIQRERLIMHTGQRAAYGYIQFAVFRKDCVFRREIQRVGKAGSEEWLECKRTAKEYDFSLDRASAGKSGNCLVDYCLENGGGNIVTGCPVIKQGLYIRFGEYAAA